GRPDTYAHRPRTLAAHRQPHPHVLPPWTRRTLCKQPCRALPGQARSDRSDGRRRPNIDRRHVVGRAGVIPAPAATPRPSRIPPTFVDVVRTRYTAHASSAAGRRYRRPTRTLPLALPSHAARARRVVEAGRAEPNHARRR